jgi:hypothetical protein
MPTSTPNFSWQLPLVNNPVDANAWGGYLNGNLSAQDSELLAAFTNNIGNSAPTSPVLTAGSTWINNTNSASWPYSIYDGSQWLLIGTIDPVNHVFTANSGGSSTAPNVRIFTGPTTYTPTPGMVYAQVEGVGGGGGGGVANGSLAGGGGSGGYFWSIFTLAAIGASQVISIGSGGTGGSYGGTGGVGGTTSFGTLCTAFGGLGGITNTPSSTAGAAVGTGGLINLPGNPATASGSLGGVSGAAPIFGAAVAPRAIAGSGLNAGAYGSGGGAGFGSAGSQVGGNGSAGLIRVIEYF